MTTASRDAFVAAKHPLAGSDAASVPSSRRPARPPLLRRLLTVRNRSLEITRAGWLFIVLTLTVGFAAVNSGSNLLHIVFGAQMALIIGSGALSEAAVARAKARRTPAASIHAGTPAPVRVELRNTHPRRELLSVSVEDDDRHDGRDRCDPVFAVAIPPACGLTLHTSVTMHRRGRHALPPAVVATRFPFGLFVKRRDIAEPVVVTVYPAIHPVPDARPQPTRSGHADASGRTARHGEFHGLREFREGDDPRGLHWPAVARLGRPVVREHEATGDTELVLALREGRSGDPAFEREVEQAASMAVAALRDGDVAVGLRYGGQLVIPLGKGTLQVRTVLEFLATVGDDTEEAAKT